MSSNYEQYLDKLVTDGIEMKGYIVDLLCGLKELLVKLDTLIAIESAEKRRPHKNPKQLISEGLQDRLRHE